MNNRDAELLSLLVADQMGTADAIAPRPAGLPAPLSFAQQQLWFLQRYEPDLTAYNLTRMFHVRGKLNVDALAQAFRYVIARHAIFRTRFEEHDGTPYQTVLPHIDFTITVETCAPCADGAAGPTLQQRLQAEINRPFDLAKVPLLRVLVLSINEDDSILVITMHHIVSDAWSNPLLARDVSAAYGAALRGDTPTDLPDLPIQYADYAAWQRQRMQGELLEAELAFWKNHLGTPVPGLDLPTDHPRPPLQTQPGRLWRFSLPEPLAAAVQAFGRAEHCTPFVVLLAAWQVVLGRHSGQEAFCIGVPNASRYRHDIEHLVGYFVNTQVYRVQLTPASTVRDLCQRVRHDALLALNHADLPLEVLVNHLKIERDPSRHPLFQVLFNFQTMAVAPSLALVGLDVESITVDEVSAKCDLTLNVNVTGALVHCELEYNAALFEPSTIERLATHYQAILAALVSAASQRLGDIDPLSEAERQHVLAWGRKAETYAAAEPVHRLIERQAERFPHATAVVCEAQALSYAELNRRANRLAHRLIRQGVGPEVKVGVAVERSLAMIVGLLGILKAGGAYVPLDPDYPRERLRYMVEDSGLRVLITQSHVQARLPMVDALPIIVLDTTDFTGEPEHNPAVPWHADNLIYVMYTSGSTGMPKGVQICHKNVVRLLAATEAWFGFGPADVWTMFHSYAFDFSVWEIFGALCYGGKLIVVPFMVSRSPEDFLTLLRHERVTILNQTPSAFRQLMQVPEVYAAQDLALRVVIFGGEALEPGSLRPWIEHFGDRQPRLINMYGITETTVHVTYRPITARDLHGQRSPVGCPIPDLGLYILDPQLNLTPVGVPGELYVAGAGLARGYLHRAGLTAERFVPDPCAAPGGRLYRTGDLGRWRTDGELEYLGRLDHQVKLRGFRIELGEIEAQLQAQAGVRDAVVVAQDRPGGMRLMGYVTADMGAILDVAGLKARLAEALPDYMVPSGLMVLEALPLGSTGKVDRRALPTPEYRSGDSHEAPQGAMEEALAAIWRDVLGLQWVGRHDNFFELGGDSILSLQIVARARQAGWQLTPRQLFERQTLARLAPVVTRIRRAAVLSTDGMAGDVPLLPLQVAFFQTAIPQRHHWNQAVLLRGQHPLDTVALGAALQALVQHHDALRLRYVEVAPGQWHQAYSAMDAADLLWVEQARDAAAVAVLCERAQRSLELTRGPLLRALAIALADGSWRLLLVIHHLAVDGVSWRILLADLQTAYQQLQAGQALQLPAKTSAYQTWARRLHDYAHSAEVGAARDYWLAVADTPAMLPCDEPQGANTARYADSVTLHLARAATHRLLQEAPAAYRTQVNDLLLTALGRVLCRWGGQEQIRIDVEGHGREDLFDDLDLSRTVGWCTSLYPVCLDPLGDLPAAIKRVKEALRCIPHKGLGFGLMKYLGPDEARQGLAALPPADVVFNYLGQFDSSFDARALWQPAPEPCGALRDAEAPLQYALTITGQVYDGALTLTVGYSRARYRPHTIAALVADYRAELLAVIDHCTSDVHGVTPSDFPLAQLTQAQLDTLPLPLAQVEDLYPLSPMQAGLLFHSLYAPESSVYLHQVRVDIEGLDVVRFRAAWQAVVARHDILRTGFVQQGDTLLQWVSRAVELPCTMHDWRDRCGHAQTLGADLDAMAQAELRHGFDVACPPLQRLVLVRTGPTRYHCLWTSHHVLLDGWSTTQLLGEVLRHYSGQPLPASGGRYREYIAWLHRQDLQTSATYWRAQLAALESPTRLSSPVPSSQDGTGHGMHTTVLDVETLTRLADCARQERVTVNTLVQAAWLILLQRYTGQDTVACGATVAGRPGELPGAEHLLGLFINTLPVIVTPPADVRVGDWLRAVQAQNLASREHEHTPLYEIQRWAGVSGQSLFDTIIVFENYPLDEVLQESAPGGLTFSNLTHWEETHYALTLAVMLEETLTLQYSYVRAQFDAATIVQIAGHLIHVLLGLASDATQAVGDIALLSTAEQAQVLAWGGNAETYPFVAPVHQVIEQQVECRPEALAVLCSDATLTYEELNRRANRLAHRLSREGVGPEVLVGLALERSPAMIVGLLAILKAGGAYVPLDPTYPAERLRDMAADSGIRVLLTQSHLSPGLPATDTLRTVALDAVDLSHEPPDNPAVLLHGDNLAYVIYTSGSTGHPKGIAVAHGPLAMHCQALAPLYGLTPADRVLQFASLSVDAATEQWLLPLLHGATLVLRDAEMWSADRLVDAIRTHQISLLDVPPAYLREVTPSLERAQLPVRACIVGGEAWRRADFAAARRALPVQRLINAYGPSEAVVTPTVWCAEAATPCDAPYAPIGRPVGERTAYVLDAALHLVPPGVAGELYLGGVGLARSYLHRPGLTAAHFVPDPFAAHGGRLYRTGDLVRWRADGALEYLGRLDHQVKLRGFRIELGEVEAQLRAQPGVHDAVVVAYGEPGAARLVGYVTPEVGETLDVADVKAQLDAALPDYMVPSALVVLEALPLLPNGKVNRQALPAPTATGSTPYEEPQGAAEAALAAIWRAVLGIERVGRHDNFFDLGGHSLTAMRAQLRIREALAIDLSLSVFFSAASLADLAAMLATHQERAHHAEARVMEEMQSLLDALGN